MAIEPFNYQKRTNIEEHNQIVDKLNEVVDAVNNIDPNPSEFEQRIDALEQSAINQQNAIDGIHTRDALQDTAIQRAEDNVSALETDVSEIGNRVGTVETQNLQQDSAIATLGQRVGATEDNVTGLTGRVGQLETDTTNLDGRVTDIDGRLTTLAGNYTTLGGRVDSINTEVGQLSTEVGGLETGKVDVAQGTENAGKYLTVGPDGNVALGDINIPSVPVYYLSASSIIYNAGSAKPTSTTVRNGIEGYVFNASYSAGTPLLVGKIVNTVTLAGVVYEIDPVSGSFTNKLQDIGGMMNYDVGTNGILTVNVWIPADEIDGRSIESITIGMDFIKIEVKSR